MKRRHFLEWATITAVSAMARRSFAGSLLQHYQLRITQNGGLEVEGRRGPISVLAGEPVQFRFFHGAANQDVLLHLPGHRFIVTALDGIPVPMPAAVEVLALAPGERVEATVVMNNPGNWLLGCVDDRLRSGGLAIPIAYADAEDLVVWRPPAAVDWSYARFTAPMRPRQQADAWTEILLEEAPKGIFRWPAQSRQRLRILNATNSTHSVRMAGHRVELTWVNQIPVAGIIKDTIRIERYSVVEAEVL